MPDTPANQAAYPQSRTQKKGLVFHWREWWVSFHSQQVPCLIWRWRLGLEKARGNHSLFRQLLHVFSAGDIMIADRYYASFFVVATLMRMGVDVVIPQHAARDCDFRKGKRISKGDHLVEWKKPARPAWMSHEEYAEYPKNITVRETKTVSQNPGFRAKTQVIVTTFVDEKNVTAGDLSGLYSLRWFVELNLRSVKTVMRMDILRGKTPEMVWKEIWAHILAYNLVRKVMLQAAVLYQRNPREISFKLALQMMSAFRQAGILCEGNHEIYAEFLRAIAAKRTGKQKRPGQPRMIKRRPKAFLRMQKPRAAYLKKMREAA
jgi:hypothetical protein